MDGFIRGALYAVSRKCSRLADELAVLHEQLDKDKRADPARALASRQRVRMTSEAAIAEQMANAIGELASAEDGSNPRTRKHEMTRYRRCVAAGRFVEYYVLPFLRGFDTKAMELTALCRQIAEAIRWPHEWPLVSRGATNYFLFIAEEEEELILAPALAGTTLLPLPDLVHEMAHALVGNAGRRQTLLGDWGRTDYVCDRVLSMVGDDEFGRMAARHWLEHGVEEIACDAIAAWVTGPAYAWQHIRACWGRQEGRSVYDESDYHPPEYVRFEVVMRALSDVTSQPEVDDVRVAWTSVIGEREGTPEGSEQTEAAATLYPTELVLELVDEVLRGCARVGIRRFSDNLSVGDPCQILNDAWREMRSDPAAFHAKERER
jgi:hypothetical protein